MASISGNQWLVNVDDNTSLTLKSNQIRISDSKTLAEEIHEPIHEDETQQSTSFSFSQKKSTNQEEY